LGPAATVRDLVDALVRPIAEHGLASPQTHWARFLHQCSADPEVGAVVQHSVEGESYREVCRRLIARLDHLPAPVRRVRVAHATGLAIFSLAAIEARRSAERAPTLPAEIELDDLIDVCTAIVSAPASAHSVQHLAGGHSSPQLVI
jgi:hypothetical protein